MPIDPSAGPGRAAVHDATLNLPIPFGWFALGFSSDLEPGDVQPLYVFDEHLVMFRSHDGVAHATAAFCPHLGAQPRPRWPGRRAMSSSARSTAGDSTATAFAWTSRTHPSCRAVPPTVRACSATRSRSEAAWSGRGTILGDGRRCSTSMRSRNSRTPSGAKPTATSGRSTRRSKRPGRTRSTSHTS